MSRAYRDTQVGVDKSRAEIAKILQVGWKVRGLQWEDDLETGKTTLRFRWKAPAFATNGSGPTHEDIVVRLVLEPKVLARAKLEREKERARETKRLHRVAFWWLKNMHEAVEAGLLSRESVLLPWIETAAGQTVEELLTPRLGGVSSGRLALSEGGR